MALNFGAIGTAVGGFLTGYDQARERQLKQQREQQEIQQQQDQRRRQQQQEDALRKLYGTVQSGALDQMQPSLPGATRMQAEPQMDGAFDDAAPQQQAPRYQQAPAGSGMRSGLPGSTTFPAGEQQLTRLGVAPEVARGAVSYMDRNESGGNPLAVNPKSGAFGRAQWLGPRKAALTSQYGDKPADEQQAQFMGDELQGPERRTLENLRQAKTPAEGYKIWGRDYERPSTAELATAVARMPPEFHQEARQTATKAAQAVPQQAYGRVSLKALADLMDKTDPGGDPLVKMYAIEQAQKLLAPSELRAWEMFKMEHNDQFHMALQDRQDARQERSLAASDERLAAREAAQDRRFLVGQQSKEDQGGQIVQQGDKTYRVKGNTMTPVTIAGTGEQAGPVTRPGATQRGTLDPSQAKFWGKVVANGGTLPPGLRRSGVVEQVMKEVPGSDPNMSPGDFIARHAGVQADTGSLRNMQKMADSAISFEKLAEKNFDVALKLAPDAVPTDLGPFFNRWVEEGETMLGDPNVPPYVTAMITGANEYAKVMSGSTGTAASTVDSRREARELFSPYLSQPQISAVIAVAKADMKNRENTLNEQVGAIKGRLGSSAPRNVAPPATPRKTGQESQSDVPAARPGTAEVQEGDTATNPQTGDKVVYRGGRWVPQ